MAELALESLVHVYREGGIRAVDGVDLRIGSGERVAIIGQNGSGKTTLVRHLNGLLRPSEGRVLVDGVDAAGLTVAQLARSVGLVFQDPDRQIFAGSVRAEVEYGPRNLGMRGEALGSAVESALATVGLQPEARTNPYDLGASRRKLLALASVLAMRTKAQKQGDRWGINGTKTFVSNGPLGDLAIVFAVTDAGKGFHGGVTAFLVPATTPGFSVGKKFEKMGLRTSHLCPAPAAHRYGPLDLRSAL